MGKKIKLVLNIEVNQEQLLDGVVTVEDVAKDLKVVSDDVVDGVVITRSGKLGDITSEFFIDADNTTIESVEIVPDFDEEQWIRQSMAVRHSE